MKKLFIIILLIYSSNTYSQSDSIKTLQSQIDELKRHRLSDTNTGLIITGIFGIIMVLLTTMIIPMLNRLIRRQEIIHKQMNGMKDQLVEATKSLGEAVGKAQGREELKTELGITEDDIIKNGKHLDDK